MAMGVQGYNMVRLDHYQVLDKLAFIRSYCNANNAADGSTFDPNSNVTVKNVATMNAELNKDINIQIKRALVYEELQELFGQHTANRYIEQLEAHEIYTHDETAILPYCVAVSMYPFLQNGLKGFGGESKAPKHLSSFNGGFVNLIFALSSQFCGAVATVEYLMYFDHFATKDYGKDYLQTHEHVITQELQQVVYALNQPASARGFQSVFWNISIFDKQYFEGLFESFVFPDGTRPNWETLNALQKFFLKWFNKERTKALLTFPVVTVSMLNDGKDIIDQEYKDLVAEELSSGNSFFIYTSDSVDSLSSCCRLRNSIKDQINDFSYSLGAGGIMTGSMNVITLNMNRFIQDTMNSLYEVEPYDEAIHLPILKEKLAEQVRLIHKYQLGFRSLFKKLESKHMLSAYDAEFISLDKQYLTIGINGLVEGAEFLGYKATNNEAYKKFMGTMLKVISDENKRTCQEVPNLKLNTECVPAENLGVKFSNWDKKDGYVVPRDCYNSYFYPVEDDDLTIQDKFTLHGNEITKYLDGGSALHLNLDAIPTKETCKSLLTVAVVTGCPYFCTNVKVTVCNTCGHIDKRTLDHCSKCNSTDIDYATRIIGYLRRISNFSKERQQEEARRCYHKIPK